MYCVRLLKMFEPPAQSSSLKAPSKVANAMAGPVVRVAYRNSIATILRVLVAPLLFILLTFVVVKVRFPPNLMKFKYQTQHNRCWHHVSLPGAWAPDFHAKTTMLSTHSSDVNTQCIMRIGAKKICCRAGKRHQITAKQDQSSLAAPLLM